MTALGENRCDRSLGRGNSSSKATATGCVRKGDRLAADKSYPTHADRGTPAMKRSCLMLAVLLVLSCAWGCKTRLKGPADTTTPGASAQPGAGAPALTLQETLAQ